MGRKTAAAVAISLGILLTVAGLGGWFSQSSLYAVPIGILLAVSGLLLLLSTQSLASVTPPRRSTLVVIVLAIALHFYEGYEKGSGPFAIGFFLWALLPYVLVLALSCFKGTQGPALYGAIIALLMDLFTFHSIFVAPRSSTAPLALIWVPIWNMLIFVPGATLIAWLVRRRRHALKDAP